MQPSPILSFLFQVIRLWVLSLIFNQLNLKVCLGATALGSILLIEYRVQGVIHRRRIISDRQRGDSNVGKTSVGDGEAHQIVLLESHLTTCNLALETDIKLVCLPRTICHRQNYIHLLTSFLKFCNSLALAGLTISIGFTHSLTVLLQRSKDANVWKSLLDRLSYQRRFCHRSPIQRKIYKGTRFGLRHRPWLGSTRTRHWRPRRNLQLRDQLRQRLQPSLRHRGLEKRRW